MFAFRSLVDLEALDASALLESSLAPALTKRILQKGQHSGNGMGRCWSESLIAAMETRKVLEGTELNQV